MTAFKKLRNVAGLHKITDSTDTYSGISSKGINYGFVLDID